MIGERARTLYFYIFNPSSVNYFDSFSCVIPRNVRFDVQSGGGLANT